MKGLSMDDNQNQTPSDSGDLNGLDPNQSSDQTLYQSQTPNPSDSTFSNLAPDPKTSSQYPNSQTPSQSEDVIRSIAHEDPPFVKEIVERPEEINAHASANPSFSLEEATSSSPTENLAINHDGFMQKIDIDSDAEAVLNKASESENPEAVFDEAEMDKDKKLAEKLIQEAGLSPEIVNKALQDKKETLQNQDDSVAPTAASPDFPPADSPDPLGAENREEPVDPQNV